MTDQNFTPAAGDLTRAQESGVDGYRAETDDALGDLDIYEALINPHDNGGARNGGAGAGGGMMPMGMMGGGAGQGGAMGAGGTAGLGTAGMGTPGMGGAQMVRSGGTGAAGSMPGLGGTSAAGGGGFGGIDTDGDGIADTFAGGGIDTDGDGIADSWAPVGGPAFSSAARSPLSASSLGGTSPTPFDPPTPISPTPFEPPTPITPSPITPSPIKPSPITPSPVVSPTPLTPPTPASPPTPPPVTGSPGMQPPPSMSSPGGSPSSAASTPGGGTGESSVVVDPDDLDTASRAWVQLSERMGKAHAQMAELSIAPNGTGFVQLPKDGYRRLHTVTGKWINDGSQVFEEFGASLANDATRYRDLEIDNIAKAKQINSI